MSVRGVVLAAGLATRMPNKALLPLKNGRPAITSSIDLLLRSKIDDVVVVIPENSVVPDVLDAVYGCLSPSFVVQSGALGYPNAVGHALRDREPADVVVVTCCDNVYSNDETVLLTELTNVACTRRVPYWRASQLAKWSALHAWTKDGPSRVCFAGYAVFYGLSVDQCHYTTTVDMLNALRVEPLPQLLGDWYDIGTVETYTAYWRS